MHSIKSVRCWFTSHKYTTEPLWQTELGKNKGVRIWRCARCGKWKFQFYLNEDLEFVMGKKALATTKLSYNKVYEVNSLAELWKRTIG